MRTFITTLLVCVSTLTFSQEKFQGIWKGTLYQESGGLAKEYYFEIHFGKRNGNKISGHSIISLNYKKQDLVGKIQFNATIINDSTLSYRETKIIAENIVEGSRWCIKKSQLKLKRIGDLIQLGGDWNAIGCTGGNLIVHRKAEKETDEPIQELDGREINVKETIKVPEGKFKIEFWDNDREDGDIISLNFNEEWILRNVKVAKKRRSIELDIKKGTNTIVLHAENMGQYPPNTAAFSMNIKGKERTLVLNSGYGFSQAIVFEGY